MDFYKLISAGYDELYGEEQEIKLKIIKENLGIMNSDLILDIGCGTGLFEFNCKFVGIDISIELLQQNNNQNNYYSILARAESIPFKDHVFDKVISVTSMHNFEDIKLAISEIKRVGKNIFAFSILKKSRFFDGIEKQINKNFNVKKIIDGKQDWIFICG